MAPTRPRPAGPRLELSWLFLGLALALLIGLRHEVGGDWGTYERHYLYMVGAPLAEVLEQSDPGYYLLNWLAAQVDGGVHLVNLGCGVLFSWGLVAFAASSRGPGWRWPWPCLTW